MASSMPATTFTEMIGAGIRCNSRRPWRWRRRPGPRACVSAQPGFDVPLPVSMAAMAGNWAAATDGRRAAIRRYYGCRSAGSWRFDDLQGHVGRIGVVIDKTAVAVQVLDHRHARFGEQASDQALCRRAARMTSTNSRMVINSPTAARSVVSMTCTVIRRQAGGFQTFLHQRGNGAVGADDSFRAAAQDGGVAGFQAQAAASAVTLGRVS